jgi:hypothetical protein
MEAIDKVLGFLGSEQGIALVTLVLSVFVGGSKAKVFGGERFKTIKRIARRGEDAIR